jgi:hypothetical protein
LREGSEGKSSDRRRASERRLELLQCNACIRKLNGEELAGHRKLDITQRYLHASAADLTAAIAKLPGNYGKR